MEGVSPVEKIISEGSDGESGGGSEERVERSQLYACDEDQVLNERCNRSNACERKKAFHVPIRLFGVKDTTNAFNKFEAR